MIIKFISKSWYLIPFKDQESTLTNQYQLTYNIEFVLQMK